MKRTTLIVIIVLILVGAAAYVKTGGSGERAVCPSAVALIDNGLHCTITVGTRLIMNLPADSYDVTTVTIKPADRLGRTFGTDAADASMWVAAYEARTAGAAVITVPALRADGVPYRIELRIVP